MLLIAVDYSANDKKERIIEKYGVLVLGMFVTFLLRVSCRLVLS